MWVIAVKAIFPSMNTKFYGWKVRMDVNAVPKWFGENQLAHSTGNSSETD